MMCFFLTRRGRVPFANLFFASQFWLVVALRSMGDLEAGMGMIVLRPTSEDGAELCQGFLWV